MKAVRLKEGKRGKKRWSAKDINGQNVIITVCCY